MVKTKRKQELGLIGFGAFGRFMVKHLKRFFDIHVYDGRNITGPAKKLGVKTAPLKDVASKRIVVIAVPVQCFGSVIGQIKGFVRPESLVLDVSSVKVKPVMLMKKHLPKNVDIIGTHPLFGPQSGKRGIKGLKIVLCPVRIKSIAKMKNFLTSRLGLNVMVKTPEEHDRQMAYVQGMTHFIGKAVNEMDIKDFDQKTAAYQHVLDIKEMLKDDSLDLFLTLEKENPYAKSVRKKFVKRLQQIEKRIQS
jgi:prephenate dehydrogenase